MPPKKRDKEPEVTKNPRMDQIQADHELFLQAFEKPTQIYRFLRTRNMLSPVFLNRTLSYMKNRMSRTHKRRKDFCLNTMMERMIERNKEIRPETFGGYITLIFLGFYDKKVESQPEPVKVETLLLKICHKKRKDVSSPYMQISVGTSDVPINPSEDNPPTKAPSVSIPNESFNQPNGNQVKSYMLLLRVSCMSNNSSGSTGDTDTAEPAQKRRKSSSAVMKGQIEEVKLFGAELVVYDKHNRCLLTDGDYELILNEVQTHVRSSPKKHSSWENIGEVNEDCGPFEVFSKCPTLKFRLSWTEQPSNGLVDRPKPIRPCDQSSYSSNKENHPEHYNHNIKTEIKREPGEERLQIVYQFLYNNNSRQQTEACEDLTCPWCSLDCVTLYSLLKHLKLCHSRFTFTYVPINHGARIDVAINECYDGSYTGSPHDLISQPPGFAFSRNGPVRRTSVSNVLVCRPKRPKPSLQEFLELDENEFDGQRPYITGHNRLYHHTTTCLPIYPKEMDVDSEGEHDPKWLQTKTMMMIDDFTDVNEGEKELMKMWNLHIMKYGFVGDCQIPLACTMFLEAKGRELLQKNLYRNFVLHLGNLHDFGLLSPVSVYTIIQRLQDLITEDQTISEVMQNSWVEQKKNWATVNHMEKAIHQSINVSSIQLVTANSVAVTSLAITSTTNTTLSSASAEPSLLRRKGASQNQAGNNKTHNSGNTQTQQNVIVVETNLRRKSCSSVQSETTSQVQQRRKTISGQTHNSQQNSKSQTSNNGTESCSTISQRRKSSSSLNSQVSTGPTANQTGNSNENSSQARRKYVNGVSTNSNQNHSDTLTGAKRKSISHQASNENGIGKVHSITHNGASVLTSTVVDASAVSHRRKSSQQTESTQMQGGYCKSNSNGPER